MSQKRRFIRLSVRVTSSSAAPAARGQLRGNCPIREVQLNCSSVLCSNPAELAKRYAQTAGVLAGFVFAALPLVINRLPSSPKDSVKRSRLEGVLITLLVAMTTLIITALIFGGMSAEERVGGRVGIQGIAGGIAFASSVFALNFGLIILFEAEELLKAAWWARLVSGAFVPFVIICLIMLALVDAHALKSASHEWSGVGWAAVSGVVLVLVVIISAWLLPPQLERGHYRNWVAVASALSTFLSVILFAGTSFIPVSVGLPDAAEYIVVAVVTSLAIAFVTFVAQTRTPRSAFAT